MTINPSRRIPNVGNRGDGNLRLMGLIGLGPASGVFTCSLLDRRDRLLSSFNPIYQNAPYDLVYQYIKEMDPLSVRYPLRITVATYVKFTIISYI